MTRDKRWLRRTLISVLAVSAVSGCVVKSGNDPHPAPVTTTPQTGTAHTAAPGTGFLSASIVSGVAVNLDNTTAGATLTQYSNGSLKIAAPNIPTNGSSDTVTVTSFFQSNAWSLPGALLFGTSATQSGSGLTLYDAGSIVQLVYSDFGFWFAAPSASASATRTEFGVYDVASGSPVTTILPTTGTAVFTGQAVGYASNNQGNGPFSGLASLTANFAGSAIRGTISGIRLEDLGSTTAFLRRGTINDIALAATISGTAFGGTATAVAAAGSYMDISGASGSFGGNFYGPAGQEVAGVFELAGGPRGTQVIGSFGALQSSSSSAISPGVSQLAAVPNGTPFTLTRSAGFESATFGIPATTGGAGGAVTLPSYTLDTGTNNAAMVFYSNGNIVLTAPDIPVASSVTVQGSSDTVTFTQSGFQPAISAGAPIIPSGTRSETANGLNTATPVTLYRSGATAGLVYSDFGEWLTSPATGNSSAGVYAVGVPTPTSQMPSTGSASYAGTTSGVISGKTTTTAATQFSGMFSGTAQLSANFATKAITGTLANLETQFSPTSINTLGQINLTGAISGTGFTGTAAAQASPQPFADLTGATGAFGGGFYGPNAAEIAGTFHLTGGTSQVVMIGSFGAHR